MKLFTKDRKGQLSMSFNWIFVLIIGAVLLGFFFTAISSGSKTTEQKISVSLVKHFETIIFSSGQKSGTLKTYATPEVELSFVCDDADGYYNYRVGDLKARDTKYDILFTPETLKGDSIITWTQNWQVPYSVATVMYITNKNQMFVFENKDNTNSRLFKDLTENFAQNVTTYVIDNEHSFDTVPKGYTQYTYVLLANDTGMTSNKFIKEDNVNVVLIYPAKNDVFAYGDVFFFDASDYFFNIDNYDLMSDDVPVVSSVLGELSEEFGGGQIRSTSEKEGHSGYIGKAGLYGAVFSGTQNLYECNMNKARHRLLLLTTLQKNKLDVIGPDVSSNCQQMLGLDPLLPGPFQTLTQIEDYVAEESFDFRVIPQIYTLGSRLQEQNDDLSVLGSCPTVY